MTNAARLLSAAGITFEARSYEVDVSDLSCGRVAAQIGLPKEQLFKTLVLSGVKVPLFVCVIPCSEEIDLKKAARKMGEKNVRCFR